MAKSLPPRTAAVHPLLLDVDGGGDGGPRSGGRVEYLRPGRRSGKGIGEAAAEDIDLAIESPAAENSRETLMLGPISQRLKRASKIETVDEGTSETEPPRTKIRGPRTVQAATASSSFLYFRFSYKSTQSLSFLLTLESTDTHKG